MQKYKSEVLDLYIKGYGQAAIADMLQISMSTVRKAIDNPTEELIVAQQEIADRRLANGWVQWKGYILSPQRTRFLRMAKNGLWVTTFASKKPMGNKIYKRLGKIYLNTIEKELRGEL